MVQAREKKRLNKTSDHFPKCRLKESALGEESG